MNNPTSQIISRRYILREQIGAGGMGQVFRAVDRLSGQAVALKQVTVAAQHLVFASIGSDSNPTLSLAQEFKVLSSLRHPNIISVLDYGFDEEQKPFFTMELLEQAQEITDCVNDKNFDIRLDLLIQILQALVYLH